MSKKFIIWKACKLIALATYFSTTAYFAFVWLWSYFHGVHDALLHMNTVHEQLSEGLLFAAVAIFGIFFMVYEIRNPKK
ncbi:MAG: hypothetical protein PHN44_05760 [Candidatus Marinimicrobia bacterium]|nr:hypothetical protein [Candidatus Neomarinimicrobiota bacterium]